MKRHILIGVVALVAGPLLAADSSPKDDVLAAAKKLADKDNYSWHAVTDFGANSPFGPLTSDGKTEKNGYTTITSIGNDNTTEGVVKDKKAAVKTDEGWKTADEVIAGSGGGPDPSVFMARRLQNLRLPAADLEDLASKVKELKKDGDAYSGELTEEGAKALLTFGFGRRGGPPPATSNAKGSVKFWIKDGTITKFESRISGKRDFNGEEREIERNTTVEVKDVGATKVNVPDDAKKKLS